MGLNGVQCLASPIKGHCEIIYSNNMISFYSKKKCFRFSNVPPSSSPMREETLVNVSLTPCQVVEEKIDHSDFFYKVIRGRKVIYQKGILFFKIYLYNFYYLKVFIITRK